MINSQIDAGLPDEERTAVLFSSVSKLLRRKPSLADLAPLAPCRFLDQADHKH